MAEREREPQTIEVYRCIILNGDNNVLLVQRAKDDRWNPEMWELPGGKREPGQDGPTALVEEVFQETGFQVKAEANPIYTENSVLTEGHYRGKTYRLSVYIGEVTGGQEQLSSEHDYSGWFSPEEALSLKLTEQTRRALATLSTKVAAKVPSEVI